MERFRLLPIGLALAVLGLANLALPAAAADWPMWRCDAQRSGATEMELPAAVHLQWVREYPPIKADYGAFGDRSGWAPCYLPIVVGKTMFLGSSRNDSVSAIDVESGAEKWRAYTDGPVRQPPVAWGDKIYVASDDGYLHCLNAADGKPVWKFRGAPANNKVLGDERLVSAWPVRGGPVVADGTVYFSAGIWPFMGLYVYSLNADSGKVNWICKDLGDGWNYSKKNVCPQGPLVVAGDKLLIPCSGLGVACLDRNSGKFSYYAESRGSGSWMVGVAGNRIFCGKVQHDLPSGRMLYDVVYNCPHGFPVLAGNYFAYMAPRGGKIAAQDFVDAKAQVRSSYPDLWAIGIPDDRPRESLPTPGIKAGSRLYLARGKKLFAVDPPGKAEKPQIAWSTEVAGDVEELLAAADRLFVVTRQGNIMCFGGAKPSSPKTWGIEIGKSPATADEWGARAEAGLKAAGVRDGYCVVLGAGSGRLAEELVERSKLDVIALDPDAAKVGELRRRWDKAGVYGGRLVAHVGDAASLGLPSYLASLVVVENPAGAGLPKGEAFARDVFRLLRPYGGTMCLRQADLGAASLESWVKAAVLENAEVRKSGDLLLLVRQGALPGSAPWTHQYADAANTVVSEDNLVKAPLGLLWFGGPSSGGKIDFQQHWYGPAPHVVGGRIIAMGDQGLSAVDAYTGRLLWQTKTAVISRVSERYVDPTVQGEGFYDRGGVMRTGGFYVSLADGLYLAGGQVCLRLDPATGEKTSEFSIPSEGGAAPTWGAIRVWEDVLVAGVNPFAGDKKTLPQRSCLIDAGSARLAAFDRNTGKPLWSITAEQGFGHHAVAVGGGKVFAIDMWPKTFGDKPTGGKLLALDARTGKELWSTKENVFGAWLGYSQKCGVVVQSSGLRVTYPPNPSRSWEKDPKVIAFKAEDGKVLWQGGMNGGFGLLRGDELIPGMGGGFALDLLKGTNLKRHQFGLDKNCGHAMGGQHVITVGRSVAYWDLDADTGLHYLGGVRTGCSNAAIPAEGVLNVPFFGGRCGCYFPYRKSLALMHMPELPKIRTGAGELAGGS